MQSEGKKKDVITDPTEVKMKTESEKNNQNTGKPQTS